MDFEPDSAPLAKALTEIARIVDASESDPREMLRLLDQIEDAAAAGRAGYRINVNMAQEEELKFLRAGRG